MPPPEGDQRNAAHNLPVRSPLKPTQRDGMSSRGFGATGRPSSTLPITHRGYHLSDSVFFRRSFDPTPYHGGSSLSGMQGTPSQQVYSRPHMQRPIMSSSLLPTRHWQTPAASIYGSSYSAGFGLDGQLMSSPNPNPGLQQHSSTPTARPKSSFSVVMKPATSVSSLGQIATSGSAVQGLYHGRSGSDPPSLGDSSTPLLGRSSKSDSFAIEIPSLTPKKRGRPFKDSEKVPSSDPNPKKRGRPFKTAESAAKAAAAGSDSADGFPKKRGRPFKIRTQLDIPVPEPVFFPFICEWQACPAELQNLETLEAHVFNVHNNMQPSGARLCLWGKCALKHEPADDSTKSPKAQIEANEFKTKMEWKEHINEQHLIPCAWHMGDGPWGTSLSIKSDSTSWLKDKDGGQVTPSVKDQPIEEGRAKDNNARRFIRKIDGIHYIYERIKSPEAYMKVQAPPSDGDDEDDNRMDESS